MNSNVRLLHLSVRQGSSEARNEPYKRYGEVSTGVANAVGHQKLSAQVAVLTVMKAVQEA